MVLKKWNNQGEMPRIFNDMLENFFDDQWTGSQLSKRVPDINVKEDSDQYTIEVAAPGMKKDDFNVNLDDGVLTISAEQQKENETTDEKYTRKEFNYSTFKRSFTLPDSVNIDEITAEYNNGVLDIALPKKEEAKKASARSIDIQ